MMKRTATAAILVLAVSQLMFSACKKSETTRPTAPQTSSDQAHRKEMLKKSFEESKKVVAAKVNGEAITEFFVLREMNAIAPQYLPAGQAATPELNAKIRTDALNTLIVQELAVQEAKKRGMKVKPEIIDNEIKNIRTKAGTEAAFQEYLANNGLTEDELRKMIEQDAVFELMATHEVDAKIQVSDAVLRERYRKEKSALVTKDAFHRQLSFEESKGLLEQKIRAEAGEKRMQAWEKELKKKARIEIMKQGQKQG
jgi:hypothetical protein